MEDRRDKGKLELRAMESDGLVHHWAQGPMDVTPKGHGRWEFRWMLETHNPNGRLCSAVSRSLEFVLNRHPDSWGFRTGVDFREVASLAEANIVVRFTDDPPPGHPWASGYYWYDQTIGKAVAQVSPRDEYFNNTPSLAYLIGMELAGHGCFRMWDMYTEEHQPYVGAMGDWGALAATNGFPTATEVECARAWLEGRAVHVHSHGVVLEDMVDTRG